MRAGIANFRKMLKAGKVLNANGAGGVAGSMAATTEEGMNNGVGTNTSGVGEGTESILLGPKLTDPAQSPVFIGQRVIHEGLRCKMELEITANALQGGGAGPGQGAPAGERKEWLKMEILVLQVDENYWQIVRDTYAGAGQAANAAWADRFRRKRELKINAYLQELDRLGC